VAAVDYAIRKDCRLCGAEEFETVYVLKHTPLANEFTTRPVEADMFPLYIVQCKSCSHVQLPVVVNPERLFRNYVYVSGTSKSFVQHFERYADDMMTMIPPGSFVVDVGSNDGTLLKAFKARGCTVLGVDPARDIAAQASRDGIETWPEFFDANVANRIAGRGRPALITANNVFAHADDLGGIATAARNILAPGGLFVFEVSYLANVVDRCLFDTIYHEHVSYHHLAPLVRFFADRKMSLFDAMPVDTHGGSIRCYVGAIPGMPMTHRLRDLLTVEQHSTTLGALRNFADRARDTSARIAKWLVDRKAEGVKVVGYGAPAKATTMSYQAGISADQIAYVVDDSPWKQGLRMPGTGIPVKATSALNSEPAGALLLFAWNFADQIVTRHQGQRFFVPLPQAREVLT
jgi:SAM-dependent methyltransferase